MAIPARLRKVSDLVTYTKFTTLTAAFLKQFNELKEKSNNKLLIEEVMKNFINVCFKISFALNEADKLELSNPKRLDLQKAAKIQLSNIQIIINFISTLEYEIFKPLYHFSTEYFKIDSMLTNWIKSDKKRLKT